MNPEVVGALTAARAAEQAHFDALTEAGAEPSTLEFTIPDPELFTNVGMFLETVITLEEAFIAAYLAAAQAFSILGEASMARMALRIGAVEAEHRVGARFFAIQADVISGTPNDVAFEKALFGSVGEVATLLEELGFIGGDGETMSFPGPGEIDTADTIETRLSRRTVLMSAGFVAVGFTAAQAGFLRTMAAQSDELRDILDITATTERFGVTFLGEGLASNEAGNFDRGWPDSVVEIVTAARAQEQFHLDAFEQAGGTPMVDTFTIPPEFLTSFDAFFGAVVEQEAAETGAQVAAMKAFTELERPDLVKISFQYAAEEAEHRLLANYTLGTRPANDIAFAPAPFETVAEFLASLEERGIIGGSGTEIVFPGPGEIDDTNVTEQEPGGPAVDCAPSSTPTANR